jgi:formyl-CoA transferase
VRDIFADPHARSRDMLVEVEQAGYAARKAIYAGTPIKLTATPGGVYRRPPRLGEHTQEILAELGIESGPSPVRAGSPSTEKETTP